MPLHISMLLSRVAGALYICFRNFSIIVGHHVRGHHGPGGDRRANVNPSRESSRVKPCACCAILARPAAEVARELGVRRNQLYKWDEQFKTKGTDKVFRR